MYIMFIMELYAPSWLIQNILSIMFIMAEKYYIIKEIFIWKKTNVMRTVHSYAIPFLRMILKNIVQRRS